MKKDMEQMLVEITIRRTLQHIKGSPERAVRNLVDLGLEFSNGRFQKRFLETMQKMLRNPKSAYYTLVSDVINSVDADILTTFCMDLGYNGCTKGARIIRQIEAERGFNIPWSLSLNISEDTVTARPEFYPNLLDQGVALGIHTFILFTFGNPEKLIPLVQAKPNCAFIFFLHGCQVNDSFIEKISPCKNVMFSVYDDEDMPAACQKLRSAKFLYSVYLRYTKEDKARILNDEWFQELIPIHPAFAVLRTDEYDQQKLHKEIYDHVVAVRNSQKYPFILIDLKYDALAIDRIISDGECVVGFDADGSLRAYDGIHREKQFNIFDHSLEDVLLALPTVK